MWLLIGLLLGCIGEKDDTETGDTVDSSATTTDTDTTDPACDDEAPEITSMEVTNAGLSNGKATVEIALAIADSDAQSLNEMSFQIWVEDDLDGQLDPKAAGAITTNDELDNQGCDSIVTDMSLYLPVETMQIPDGAGGYKQMPFNTELEIAVVMADADGLASTLVYGTFISPMENGLDGDGSGTP